MAMWYSEKIKGIEIFQNEIQSQVWTVIKYMTVGKLLCLIFHINLPDYPSNYI